MVLAVGDVAQWEKADTAARMLGRPAEIVLADPEAVVAAINLAYQQQTGRAQEMIQQLDRKQIINDLQNLAAREDLLDIADRAPVIKLVNLILFEAVESGASDVHIQPRESRLVVRMRIDGVLYDTFAIPQQLQEEVISRVKVMGRMNIAEKRLPQDGRATAQVGDRLVDLRIASLPTSHGERVVLRLLDKSTRTFKLGEIGMGAQTLRIFRQLITIDHGMILVTGPTGSGKSTTLYSALRRDQQHRAEHPDAGGPDRVPARGDQPDPDQREEGDDLRLRAAQRAAQDPDIIMVGEIRDRETAVMAMQSALTGHLVFSTLHTNDAASAVTRLLDLGIEPYLASSSLTAVLAQRLVRRVCPYCTVSYVPGDAELATLGVGLAETRAMRIGAAARNAATPAIAAGSGRLNCWWWMMSSAGTSSSARRPPISVMRRSRRG